MISPPGQIQTAQIKPLPSGIGKDQQVKCQKTLQDKAMAGELGGERRSRVNS